MNKKNILRVADAIEKGELVKRGIGFNMAYYIDEESDDNHDHFHSCQTTACIAGWAYSINHPDYDPNTSDRPYDVAEDARAFLGLGSLHAADLFTPLELPEPQWANITPAHAVAVLRHLAETGKVDWSVGAP